LELLGDFPRVGLSGGGVSFRSVVRGENGDGPEPGRTKATSGHYIALIILNESQDRLAWVSYLIFVEFLGKPYPIRSLSKKLV
jgi:hypothetical protein